MTSRQPARAISVNSVIRLTRRGRLTVGSLLAAAVLAITGLALSSASASPEMESGSPPAEIVVVAPGDTLWDIARRADPHGDPRVLVAQITELNGLTGVRLRPGQRLQLPAQ